MRKYLSIAAALVFVMPAARAAAPAYDSSAPIAYMIDLSSGRVLYDRQGEKQIPPASMAKMMTAHVAFRLIQQGKLKLDQSFTMRPETWKKWHSQGSTMFLAVNEPVSVENLLHGIVTLSGNDACVVLAEGIAGTEESFVDLMNAEARRLGLTGSRFGNSNGWPDEGRTVVTARDLAKLAAATISETPDLYKQFYATTSFRWGKTMGGDDISQANRNPILGKIAGADGLKTGHTEEAGYGFTGSAIQNGRRLVMVVAGLDSFNGRISESVSEAIESGLRSGVLLADSAFITHQQQTTVPVRCRSEVNSPNLRKPEMIPPAELRQAVDAIGEAGRGRQELFGAAIGKALLEHRLQLGAIGTFRLRFAFVRLGDDQRHG